MNALTSERARMDLATRADVEALLRRFYGQVLVDDVLAHRDPRARPGITPSGDVRLLGDRPIPRRALPG